jgi:hypothetical protein
MLKEQLKEIKRLLLEEKTNCRMNILSVDGSNGLNQQTKKLGI